MATRSFAADSYGHLAARQARDVIERAVLDLQALDTLPPGGLGEVSSRLLHAIAALYVVRDTSELSTAHLEGLGLAAATVSEVEQLVGRWTREGELARPVRALLRTAEQVLRPAFDRVAQVQVQRRTELEAGRLDESLPAPRPLVASLGVPQLHAIARRPLLPHLAPREADEAPVPPAAPPVEAAIVVANRDDLRSLGARIKARAAAAVAVAPPPEPREEGTLPWIGWEPAVEEVEVLRRLGRDALEEIALARTLRTPNDLETWTDIAPFEQRLLDQLDAFVSYGPPALGVVPVFLFENGDVDADRAFAASLALGSIDGADAIGALSFDLRQSGPEAWPGFVDGLALAPNPRIDVWMDDLARSQDPRLAEVGLEVLARRGTVPADLALTLRESEVDGVASRALRALGRVGDRATAMAALELALGGSPGPLVRGAALEALLERRHPDAVTHLAGLARTPGSTENEALVWLAIAGGPEHDELLWSRFVASPTERLARALGRHGSVGLVDLVIESLGSFDGPVQLALVEGLELATGAQLFHEVEEPWPVEIPEGVDPTGVQFPTRRIVRSIQDPGAWRAYWSQRGASLRKTAGGSRGSRKVRHGRLFLPELAVEEARQPRRATTDREEALREARWASGALSHVWLGDWVVKQAAQLERLAIEVRASGVAEGSWASRRGGEPASSSSSRPPPPASSSPPGPPPLAPASSPPPASLAHLMAALVPPSSPPAVTESSAPPVPLVAPAPLPRAARKEVTMMGNFGPRGPALPFAPTAPTTPSSRPPAPSSSPPDASSVRPGSLQETSSFVRPSGPATPFAAADRGATPKDVSKVSLATYAAVCAEVAARPELAESIFARYGMGDPQFRAAVDGSYKRRMAADAELRRKFDEAFARATSALR